MKKTHEKSLINLFRSKKFLPEKYKEDKDLLVENSTHGAIVMP